MFVMRTNNNNNNKSNVTLLKENTGRHMERNEERKGWREDDQMYESNNDIGNMTPFSEFSMQWII